MDVAALYVSDALIDGLRERLGEDFELLDYECDHMVPHAKPEDVAALVRKRLQLV